jgi:hypothetical protein
MASATALLEASDLPGEPMYQPVIPFYPGGITSGSSAGSLASGTNTDWERVPTDLDITFHEGDDVMIPLYIADPNNPLLNMSDQSQWHWYSQIRRLPYYGSVLVAEFSTDSTYYPPGTLDPTVGTTLVQLFLPREMNTVAGEFAWELYSISPVVYSPEFVKPDDWPTGDVWPPTTTLRTWLSGDCTIQLRTTATDEVPVVIGTALGPNSVLVSVGPPAVTDTHIIVGPNGRVP